MPPVDSVTVICEASSPRRTSFGQIAESLTGGVLLAALGPVLAGAALTIVVLSKRSPFVAHLRVGQDGEPFWMLKLRTMWPRERESRLDWMGLVERVIAEPAFDCKPCSDPRVTSRFAAFCRRHSIDELPQLWHVVCGEMSLVGPRPLTRTEIERHYGSHAAELLSVKPGLTGLWQTGGRSELSFEERAALDLKLVRTLSVKTYLRILLRTIPALLHAKGAW